jgi:uncharacterized membrane protein
MVSLIIILRIIHIFSGVFWVGVSFFNIGFLQPTVRATGAEGQVVMRHLSQKTRLLVSTYTAATLNMLSGLILYGIFFGFQLSALTSGQGLTLTIGGIAGVIAWVIAIVVVRGIFSRMQAIGRDIQAQGGPPTPEQSAEMQALGARLGKVGQAALVLMIIALLGMSMGRYVTF